MTEPGTRRDGGLRTWRTVVAVLALYGLVLQAVFGGAAAFASPSSFDALCLDQADGSGSTDRSTPAAPGHRCAGCCTLAHAATAVEPPALAVHLIAWPSRRAERLVWRQEGAVAARAPPDSPASPRAPPVV